MKLTDKQIEHLRILKAGSSSAYAAGLHMGVLNSLSLKGLVSSQRPFGSLFAPHNNIKWQITDAGRAALQDRGTI